MQDNHSRSEGVLRGLHLQVAPQPQAKLVRCSLGEIFDVAVDLRGGSPSFGKWVGARLSASKHQQLWVPVGFAHGFLTLSEHAEVLYKTSHFWNRDCERSLRWDDPSLSIDWPLEGCRCAQWERCRGALVGRGACRSVVSMKVFLTGAAGHWARLFRLRCQRLLSCWSPVGTSWLG